MNDSAKKIYPGLENFSVQIARLHRYVNAHTGMSTEEFSQIINYCEIRQFDKKEIILQPGDQENYFNLILKGVVRKYMLAGKQEVTLQLSKEGHFIHAEISFFERKPALCWLETLESTTCLSITRQKMDALLVEVPITNRLGRLMAGELYARKVMRDLIQMQRPARDRFLQYIQKHPDMLLRVPQKYLASYLQIKPETFSRLKHLVKQP
ncbi:MAG TPA: Crp/Fnr family transcriptional regulator [Flavihumibacter sp.]|nr:Crp/Fnr family transcriptional regulator [Flavihumibacter sp.]HQD09355.1 Crp/Fnr family transcriptional regulator [Flavihumibacter sp.]